MTTRRNFLRNSSLSLVGLVIGEKLLAAPNLLLQYSKPVHLQNMPKRCGAIIPRSALLNLPVSSFLKPLRRNWLR